MKYIHRNELDKAYFQNDVAYGDFKDLAKRTVCDKVLRDKALTLLKTLNMINIKEVLLLWFTYFLIKNLWVGVLLIMKLNKICN